MKLKEAVEVIDDLFDNLSIDNETKTAWDRVLRELQVCNYHLEERE